MTFIVNFFKWIVTAYQFVTKPSMPIPVPGRSFKDVAYDIIMANTVNIPPLPKTGGIIHKVLPRDATYISENMAVRNITGPMIALKLAWSGAESKWDKLALNPNKNKITPGMTTEQKMLLWDVGFGQNNITANRFSFPKLTLDQIVATLYDLVWAYTQFEEYTNGLLGWAKKFDKADIVVKNTVYPFQELCAIEAYNKGRSGVEKLIGESATSKSSEEDFYATNFAYAIGVLNTATTYSTYFV